MFQASFIGNQFARGAAVAMVMLVMVATLIVPVPDLEPAPGGER